MPFRCGFEGGEVRLTPAREVSYPIVGRREQQTITTCPAGDSVGCRTVMVHSFDIACAGDRSASWMEIVASIGSSAANRSWIEEGRLHLVMPARAAREAPAGCFDRNGGGDDLERRVVLSGDCLPWPRKASFEHMVLPEGYAPVGEVGARLLIADTPGETRVTGPTYKAMTRLASVDDELVVAKADPEATLDPAGRRDTFETTLEPEVANDDWITVVRAEPETQPWSSVSATPPQEPAPVNWGWLAAIGSTLTLALLLLVRYAPAIRARVLSDSAFRMARRETNIANASQSVAALLEQTEAATRELKGAGPLREVLLGELGHVRERLGNLDRSTARGDTPAERSAPQFRALVREIERVRRIVDSAAASISNERKIVVLPRTASEAYEVLGVNAEVSDGVVKKIVDALRMSWHPDHARDESDRAVREDRIRQINIAWDLINGKREAA
jgi:hypothetical protein